MYDEKLLAVQWAEMYWSACREDTAISQAAPAPELLKKTENSSSAGLTLTPSTAGATDKEAPVVFQPGAETWVNIWLFKLEMDKSHLSVFI